MHRFPGLQIYGKCIKKKELCSVKNKIITRRNGDEMEDYSIANTTKEQRIALIRQWIPDEDGLGDSGFDRRGLCEPAQNRHRIE